MTDPNVPKTPHSDKPTALNPPDLRLSPESQSLLNEELGLLARVQSAITATQGAQQRKMSRVALDHQDEMLSLRDQVSVARAEDLPALIQQMERLQGIANTRAEAQQSVVDPMVPYFGHLRLREVGRGVRDVLVGKSTFIDPKNNIRIVDWRHAPVSQLYYRYEEGSEYDEAFGDRQTEGEVLVRRTVSIARGKLTRVATKTRTLARRGEQWLELDRVNIELRGGQGSAHRPADVAAAARQGGQLHGRSASFTAREDRHLPEISALLDPRQFELISKPDSGIVVIQGTAGSGKTTIGVHRMAFLAYQSPRRFNADTMLVITGSPALRAYISEVLVELGIGRIEVDTFEEWARLQRRRSFPWLECPREENTPSAVSRLKGHPHLLHLLEQRAEEWRESGEAPRNSKGSLQLWAEVLTDETAVLERFMATPDPELSLPSVRMALAYCRDRSLAVLDKIPADREERQAEKDDSDGDDERMRIGADGKEVSDERATLDSEDDALLLRAYQCLVGPLRMARRGADGRKGHDGRIEHLFVDETQDLAPVELAVLLDCVTSPAAVGDAAQSGGESAAQSPMARKCVTLAGDTAQRLYAESGFRDWRDVLNHLGLQSVEIEPLRIAYRSTAEIMEISRAILGPLAPHEPAIAPRHGAPVEHHHFPGPGAAVGFLADTLRELFLQEPLASVALLTRFPEQAESYFSALKMAEVPSLRRVRDYDFAFKAGIDVTEIQQVKGLEFDYVVLLDVNRGVFQEDDLSRYLLHIGATRAAHQLWLVSTEEPSLLIPEALRG